MGHIADATYDVQLFPSHRRCTVACSLVTDAADFARSTLGPANWARLYRLDDNVKASEKLPYLYVRFRDGQRAATHFVGFRDPQQVANATRLYGNPDFVHYVWDHRAKADVADGDLVVFAKYDFDKPSPYSFDDSNQPDDPAAKERF